MKKNTKHSDNIFCYISSMRAGGIVPVPNVPNFFYLYRFNAEKW